MVEENEVAFKYLAWFILSWALIKSFSYGLIFLVGYITPGVLLKVAPVLSFLNYINGTLILSALIVSSKFVTDQNRYFLYEEGLILSIGGAIFFSMLSIGFLFFRFEHLGVDITVLFQKKYVWHFLSSVFVDALKLAFCYFALQPLFFGHQIKRN